MGQQPFVRRLHATGMWRRRRPYPVGLAKTNRRRERAHGRSAGWLRHAFPGRELRRSAFRESRLAAGRAGHPDGHRSEIRTGIDLKKLVETSVRLAGRLGRPSPSAVVRALQAPV
jgi:hypothetical protein